MSAGMRRSAEQEHGTKEAREAYAATMERTANEVERAFLQRKRRRIGREHYIGWYGE